MVLTLFAHLIPPALVVTGILLSVVIYRLAKAERYNRPLLWAIWAFLPVIGYVGIYFVYVRANQVLREQGLSVGILGAKKADLEGLLKTGSEMRA